MMNDFFIEEEQQHVSSPSSSSSSRHHVDGQVCNTGTSIIKNKNKTYDSINLISLSSLSMMSMDCNNADIDDNANHPYNDNDMNFEPSFILKTPPSSTSSTDQDTSNPDAGAEQSYYDETVFDPSSDDTNCPEDHDGNFKTIMEDDNNNNAVLQTNNDDDDDISLALSDVVLLLDDIVKISNKKPNVVAGTTTSTVGISDRSCNNNQRKRKSSKSIHCNGDDPNNKSSSSLLCHPRLVYEPAITTSNKRKQNDSSHPPHNTNSSTTKKTRVPSIHRLLFHMKQSLKSGRILQETYYSNRHNAHLSTIHCHKELSYESSLSRIRLGRALVRHLQQHHQQKRYTANKIK